MTDDALARLAAHGDIAAFDQLVERHAAAGLRFATRMLGSREDAEDVTQDTWMRAYRALPRYEPSTPFRTWLFAILINRCRSALTARVRRERVVNADETAIRAAAAGSDDDRIALRLELQRAVDTLSTDLREAFLLKHIEQLEYAEMTEITGASVSALKMRVQRACLHLRDALQGLHDAR
jgi:RNA polymerase sigma-70 factor, ECF subfamily